MLEYLCIFEGVEDAYVEDIDGRMLFVVETNKTKEELKKMDEIFNDERIIVQPIKKFKNECYTPPFQLFLKDAIVKDKYIPYYPCGTLGCFCIDVESIHYNNFINYSY